MTAGAWGQAVPGDGQLPCAALHHRRRPVPLRGTVLPTGIRRSASLKVSVWSVEPLWEKSVKLTKKISMASDLGEKMKTLIVKINYISIT